MDRFSEQRFVIMEMVVLQSLNCFTPLEMRPIVIPLITSKED
jgi:hypothetical protein